MLLLVLSVLALLVQMYKYCVVLACMRRESKCAYSARDFFYFFLHFFLIFLPLCAASRGVRVVGARGELVCMADDDARCWPGSAAGSGARQYLYVGTRTCLSICASVLVKRVNVARGRDA